MRAHAVKRRLRDEPHAAVELVAHVHVGHMLPDRVAPLPVKLQPPVDDIRHLWVWLYDCKGAARIQQDRAVIVVKSHVVDDAVGGVSPLGKVMELQVSRCRAPMGDLEFVHAAPL